MGMFASLPVRVGDNDGGIGEYVPTRDTDYRLAESTNVIRRSVVECRSLMSMFGLLLVSNVPLLSRDVYQQSGSRKMAMFIHFQADDATAIERTSTYMLHHIIEPSLK
jgi:hypothetical protein